MDWNEIMTVAMRQSAVDCSCREEDFRRNTSVVVESKFSEQASRYMTLPHICALFSYGNNIVASCRRDLMGDVEAYIQGTESIYRCFDTPGIYELNQILQKCGAQVAICRIRCRFSAQICPALMRHGCFIRKILKDCICRNGGMRCAASGRNWICWVLVHTIRDD